MSLPIWQLFALRPLHRHGLRAQRGQPTAKARSIRDRPESSLGRAIVRLSALCPAAGFDAEQRVRRTITEQRSDERDESYPAPGRWRDGRDIPKRPSDESDADDKPQAAVYDSNIDGHELSPSISAEPGRIKPFPKSTASASKLAHLRLETFDIDQ